MKHARNARRKAKHLVDVFKIVDSWLLLNVGTRISQVSAMLSLCGYSNYYRIFNSLSVGGCTVLYCTVPTTVVNGCLNSHYNEDVFKKYVAELGYDYEGKPANNGLFR